MIRVLFILSIVLVFSCNKKEEKHIDKRIEVKMEAVNDSVVETHVTTTTNNNGKETEKIQVFKGAKTEVMAKIDALHEVETPTPPSAANKTASNKSEQKRKVEVKMSKGKDGLTTAKVTIASTINGEKTIQEEEFTGTLEDVIAKVEALKGANIEVEIQE